MSALTHLLPPHRSARLQRLALPRTEAVAQHSDPLFPCLQAAYAILSLDPDGQVRSDDERRKKARILRAVQPVPAVRIKHLDVAFLLQT